MEPDDPRWLTCRGREHTYLTMSLDRKAARVWYWTHTAVPDGWQMRDVPYVPPPRIKSAAERQCISFATWAYLYREEIDEFVESVLDAAASATLDTEYPALVAMFEPRVDVRARLERYLYLNSASAKRDAQQALWT